MVFNALQIMPGQNVYQASSKLLHFEAEKCFDIYQRQSLTNLKIRESQMANNFWLNKTRIAEVTMCLSLNGRLASIIS